MHEFFENKYLWNAPFLTNDCSSTFQKFPPFSPDAPLDEPNYVFIRAPRLIHLLWDFIRIRSFMLSRRTSMFQITETGENLPSLPISFVRRRIRPSHRSPSLTIAEYSVVEISYSILSCFVLFFLSFFYPVRPPGTSLHRLRAGGRMQWRIDRPEVNRGHQSS